MGGVLSSSTESKAQIAELLPKSSSAVRPHLCYNTWLISLGAKKSLCSKMWGVCASSCLGYREGLLVFSSSVTCSAMGMLPPLQTQPCICGCVVSVHWVLFPSQPKFPVGVRPTSAIGLGQWETKGFVAGAVQCCENPPSANKRCSALYLNLTFFLSSIVIPQPKIIEKQYKLSCLS